MRAMTVILLWAACAGTSTTPTSTPTDTAVPTELPEGVFLVDLDTTVGPIVLEIHRDWAPLGVDRFLELVDVGFYDDTRFFRVVPDFVVQFGMSGDPAITTKWSNATILDDPVVESNVRRMVTFATSGPDARTTQLFINLDDNSFLDDQGFAPIGRVAEGMPNVRDINAEYGEQPQQSLIGQQGNAYLDDSFPRLDGIITATLRDL
ncbi:MAG: peptidylprolyl isomerase [Myxococcales bacterium]|nr:peptidylprolyl isomerase [Myxococcales bacterium]